MMTNNTMIPIIKQQVLVIKI